MHLDSHRWRHLLVAIASVCGLAACGRAALLDEPVVAVDAGAGASDAGADDAGTGSCTAFVACSTQRANLGGFIETLGVQASGVATTVDASHRELVVVQTQTGNRRLAQLWRSQSGGSERLGEPVELASDAQLVAVGDTPLLLGTGRIATGVTETPRLLRWSCEAGWVPHSALPLGASHVAKLAVDSRGELYLGATTLTSSTLFHWTGTTWEALGALDELALSSIAFGLDGQPLVAGTQRADTSLVEVKRWDGSAWVRVGEWPPGGEWKTSPQLVVRPGGELFVVTQDGFSISFARFNGTAWQTGVVTTARGFVGLQQLVLDENGMPWVAWSESMAPPDPPLFVQVARWNGASWTWVLEGLRQEPLGEASLASLRVVDGAPVIWWHELDYKGQTGHAVHRWSKRGCGVP